MKNRMHILFCFSLLSTYVFAHGEYGTEDIQADEKRPITFLEYFFSSVTAKASIRIDEQGGYRYIESDGLADHATGRFPNSGNPHSIKAQDYNFRVPLKPRKRSSPMSIGHAAFGVAINGVPFDPATAEYWNNDRSSDWNIEALTGGLNLGLDSSNAHVQPNGAYHYHSLPLGILNRSNYKSKPVLIGYAADGFPVYSHYGYSDAADPNSEIVKLRSSYRVKSGSRSGGPGGTYDGTYSKDYEYVDGLGDLDQCNGRTGVTPEHSEGTYYYVITDGFPMIPRCWKGSGDSSFQKGPGANGPGGGDRRSQNQRSGPPGGPSGGPPQEALNACENKREGSSCSVNTPRGSMRGTCRTMRSDFVCVPQRR
ncbi:MAG: YHYH protein [Proteobacteria bacterium]|nr:YHYH protein [Pseudomonadota bacterium]